MPLMRVVVATHKREVVPRRKSHIVKKRLYPMMSERVITRCGIEIAFPKDLPGEAPTCQHCELVIMLNQDFAIVPHRYAPDWSMLGVGDCAVCGHVENDPIHNYKGEPVATGYVTRESLRHSLTNQPPRDQGIVDRFETLREPAMAFGDAIFDLCPESRERSTAITKLEEAVMWAVKSIAVNQQDIPG